MEAKNPKSAPKLLKEDYYYENNLLIFTTIYHLKRGYCCGNQCKHCPYDSKKTKR